MSLPLIEKAGFLLLYNIVVILELKHFDRASFLQVMLHHITRVVARLGRYKFRYEIKYLEQIQTNVDFNLVPNIDDKNNWW